MTTKFDIIKLKSLAALGNVEAMFTLGYNYLYGIGVEVDFVQSHSYLDKASSKGFAPAKGFIETVFADNGSSTDLAPEFKEGLYDVFKTMCQDADKGIPAALHMKSMARLSDDIDDFRFYRAVKEQEQACLQDYVPSLCSLGIVYHRGNRIKGKQHEGFEMIMRAAGKEYIPALRYLMNIQPDKAFPIIKRMSEREDAEGEVFYMLSQYYREGVVVEKNIEEFVNLLNKSAEKKYAGAYYDLGILYEHGKFGVTRDISKAVRYHELGAESGDVDSMVNLAFILERSNEYPNDYKRAFELYSKAAEKDSGKAYCNLGTCYKRGIGTDVNKEDALKCYIKSANLECLEAYWNLYLYYMDGVCTPRNFDKAVEWLLKGDKAGNYDCTYQLTKHIENGDGIERDANKYFFYMEKAAMNGNTNAFLGLANCYRDGIGTEEDGRAAFEWFEKAAKVSVEGVTALAQCYTYGVGTKQDYNKAVELYKIAAEQGDAQAQCDLGICYRSGEGVEKDPVKAIEWYLKAADQGHGGALNNLGIMYQHGIGVEADVNKAAEYYLKAAEAGNADGQFCIGLFYASGAGVEQNYEEAVRWFKAAASQGEPDSMFHLAQLYSEGLGVEKDMNLVAIYLYMAADRGFQPAIDAINKNRIPRPERKE